MKIDEQIINEYEQIKESLTRFEKRLESLFPQLLNARNQRVHKIESRVKSIESLRLKIQNKAKYTSIYDITDLIGFRIIAFYPSDINNIADIITSEFDIDPINSIDKSSILASNSFGYASIHYIAKFKSNRLLLTEYSEFSNFKIEIQIRSITQHAWSEIQHELEYKNSLNLPSNIIRRFAKLSATLELVDDEFDRLHDDIKKYKTEIETSVQKDNYDFEINEITLQEYLKSDKNILRLTEYFTSKIGIPDGNLVDPFWINNIPEIFNSLGLKSIEELNKKIIQYEELIKSAFEIIFIPYDTIKSWSRDMILFTICLIIPIKELNEETYIKLMEKIHLDPKFEIFEQIRSI
jgi:ppGpp synthetase/RelA/SpoT-type nucleotidyltranferase